MKIEVLFNNYADTAVFHPQGANIMAGIWDTYFQPSGMPGEGSVFNLFQALMEYPEVYASYTLDYDMATPEGRDEWVNAQMTNIDNSIAVQRPLGSFSNFLLRLRTGKMPAAAAAADPEPYYPQDSSTYSGDRATCGGDWTWLNFLTHSRSKMLGSDSGGAGVCEGPGNWAYSLGAAAALPYVEAWENTWRPKARQVVSNIATLLHARWSITLGTGRHKKLAETDIVVQRYGWYFFDMEKYIRQQSNLSHFLDVDKLINHFSFSQDILNYSIRLAKSRHQFLQSTSTPDLPILLSLRADVSPMANMPSFDRMGFKAVGDEYHMKIPALDVATWKDFIVNNNDEIGKTGAAAQSIGSTNIYSYLMLRNFDFPTNDPIPDEYRLMAFNYNYFMDDDLALDLVGAKAQGSCLVTVEDNSIEVLYAFGEYIRAIYAEFLVYYDLAKENCAYNLYDSQFNTFFADYMNDLYAGNLVNAPWFKAPVLMALYGDLFFNHFDGDMFFIIENARKRADNINPTTGYLEALELFKDDFDSLLKEFGDTEAEAEARTTSSMLGGGSGSPGPMFWAPTGPSAPSFTLIPPELTVRHTYVFGPYLANILAAENPELGTIHEGRYDAPQTSEIIDFVGNFDDALPETPSWSDYSFSPPAEPPPTSPPEADTTVPGGPPPDAGPTGAPST